MWNSCSNDFERGNKILLTSNEKVKTVCPVSKDKIKVNVAVFVVWSISSSKGYKVGP